MLVTDDRLTSAPCRAMDAIYGFLSLPGFQRVSYEADEFGRRLGAPDLYRVGRRVAKVERETILPPGCSRSCRVAAARGER